MQVCTTFQQGPTASTAGKRVDRDIHRTQRQNVGSSQVDVAEVYSLPRMATMAAKLWYKPGFSFDLTTCDTDVAPWDPSKANVQRKALKLCNRDKQRLLVVSPQCTAFSTLQNLTLENKGAKDLQRMMTEAIQHLSFAVLSDEFLKDSYYNFNIEILVFIMFANCFWLVNKLMRRTYVRDSARQRRKQHSILCMMSTYWFWKP